jgi:hypothetical protein
MAELEPGAAEEVAAQADATTAMPATAEATTPGPAGLEEGPPAAAPTVVDDAISAADGTRNAAKWIASSLGAIPGLTIVASIVRAPGDAGFQSLELGLGIGLAALGALIGILVFAHVISPAATEESDVEKIKVKRLAGHRFESYEALKNELSELWDLKGQQDQAVADAKAPAAKAEVELADAESIALVLKAELAAVDGKAEKDKLTAQYQTAQAVVAQKRAAATARKADVARLTALAAWTGTQIERREAIRTNLYRLAAADEVRSRYKTAAEVSFLAVALVAAGLFFLGLAPKPKSEVVAGSLVTLKLEKAGMDALGCEAKTVEAIKVGGDEKTPKVITLPSDECPTPKQVDFKTGDEKPFGEVLPAP